MKKLLSVILSLLMVFSLIPAFAISAEEAEMPEAEYAEDTVAVIGSTEYKTLFGEDGALSNTESVLAGATKDVVTLVKDVKETGSATLKSDAVLDLAGYDIINYGTTTVIDTNGYKLHIRNTAYQETNERAKFGYSGTLLSTKANVTMEDVHFYEKNVFPEYKAEVNLLDGVSWCAGMYWRDSKHKDLTNYDYQMGYTASGTKISDGVYEKQFIEVEYGKSYYTYCSTTLADSFAVTLIGFDENDTPLVNYGKTNVVTITNESVVKVGVNVYCTNEWKDTYKYGKLATCISKGEVTPYMHEITDLCKTVASANAFVNFTNSTPITWTMDNCVYNQTSGTASILNLTKPIKFDFWDSTFSFANFGGKNSFTINNASSSGGIYKCTFSGNNAQSVVINSTSSEGLVLQNCTITTSGDGRTALTISGGKVTLADGTMGSTSSSNNTNISGGNVTVTGTKFNGSKSNGYVLNISTSAVVTISKATIVKGGTTIKDTTTFLKSLSEGIALYKATTLTAENILLRSVNLNNLSAFYVDVCQHFCTATQNGSKVCAYCEGEVTSIYHDYSSIKYDATHHWGVCARCDEVQEQIEHAVGETGKDATCTEPAVCGTCNQKFGESLGHSFTDYQPVSTDVAGCEHNPVTKAICDNGCGDEDYDYSALVNLKVTKEPVDPTCTEKGSTVEKSCTECDKVIEPSEEIAALGHDFGEMEFGEGDYDSDYLNTGKASHTCQVCEFTENIVVPVKEFKGSTVAITGDYVNPVEYKTVKDAIEGVEEGGVVILVKDAALDTKLTVDKEFILDVAGHTLNVTADGNAITTDKNVELRSTLNGLGKLYSGMVEFAPSTEADTYGTLADVSNKDLYVAGHYNTSSGKLEANTNRIALNKLVAVDRTRSYVLNTGSSNSKMEFVIREYNKKGNFYKSIGGKANGVTYKPTDENVVYISVAFWINGDEATDIMAMMQNGEFTPSIELAPVRGQIKFGSAFVKTSANFKMSNLKVTASATGSFYEQTDANATPKFTAYDCAFAVASNSVIRALKFSPNASEIDMQNSTVAMGNNNNNAGFSIASASVGTFKNVKFSMATGMGVYVYNTGDAGITFDGCTITSSGDSGNCALCIAKGNVTLKGGSIGNKSAGYNTKISGGNVTIDGTKFNDAKNGSVGVLNITGGNLSIKSCTIVNTGIVTNDLDKLKLSLAVGSAFFNSTTMNANTVVGGDGLTIKDKAIYVGPCGHWERSVSKADTCTQAHVCNFCAMSFEPLGHDFSAYDYDEDSHWRICSRCKLVDEEDNEPQAHFGGAATCTEPAECEACQEYYGDSLGHAFPEPDAEGKYAVEDYSYDEDSHWICCTREGCDEAKEGSVVAHVGGTATCEDAPICDDCGQEYGIALGHSYTRYESNNDATCTVDGTETAFCDNGCGKTATRIASGSAIGHDWVEIPAKPATCKEHGSTAGTKCDNCGAVREEPEETPINYNAHIWDEGVKLAGDCATDTVYVYTCEYCGTTEQYNFGKIADSHSFGSDFVVDKPATFQEEGLKSQHCSECDATQKETKIPVLTFNAEKVSNGIEIKWDAYQGEGMYYELERNFDNNGFVVIQYLQEPYCLDTTAVVEGTYVYRVTLVCGDVRSTSNEVTVIIGGKPTNPDQPAHVHTEVVDSAVAATCTATGLTEGKHCSVCNEVLVAQQVVAATGHTEVVDGAIAPTCTGAGLTEGKHCSVCNTVLVAQQAVAATGHIGVAQADKPATYFAAGKTGNKVCACGVIVELGKAIPKLTLKVPAFKLIKGKKQFKVKYTKVADATGFQVKYKLKGKWKTKTFKTTKSATKAIKKLKKGTYKVQIRAMIKAGKQKAFSAWSKIKKVKVK